MTFEARLAFLIFFFLCWTIVALLPWIAAVLYVRGRGAALALPLAVVAAWAAGVFVPLVGMRDATGFFVSLLAAFLAATAGSIAGIAFARRIDAARARPAAAPGDRLTS
ncbi:MAG TPA: hypothetical protein VIT93_01760 [Dehalococcoidia bacterium]